ncbi:MAG: exo-alpha-sialidase [Alphaproteobacteria bacterium]
MDERKNFWRSGIVAALAAVSVATSTGCHWGSDLGPEARLTEPEKSGATFSFPYYTDIAARGNTVAAVYMVANGRMNRHVVVRRSQDGGATWGAPFVLDEPGYGDTISVAPKLVPFADGSLLAVWQARRNAVGEKFILSRRSTDFGGSFADTQKLNEVPQSFPGAIASRPDGAVLVAYSDERNIERDIFANHSSDGGATWTMPDVILAPSDKAESVGPAPAIGKGGEAWVAWEEKKRGDAAIDVVHSSDAGATWSKPVRIDDPKAKASPIWPALVEAGGRLTAAWTGGFVGQTSRSWLWMSSSTDGGKTWSAPNAIYEGAAQTLFQLLSDGTRVFLVWHGGAADETGIYFNSSADGGATWSRPFDAPARLDDARPAILAVRPRMSFDGDRIAVTWQEGDKEVVARLSNDGGKTWLGDKAIRVAEVEKGNLRLPQVAVSDQGAWVLWERWADMTGLRKTLADADLPTPIDIMVRKVPFPK